MFVMFFSPVFLMTAVESLRTWNIRYIFTS